MLHEFIDIDRLARNMSEIRERSIGDVDYYSFSASRFSSSPVRWGGKTSVYVLVDGARARETEREIIEFPTNHAALMEIFYILD